MLIQGYGMVYALVPSMTIDTAVKTVTAFQTFAELATRCAAGYVPTLNYRADYTAGPMLAVRAALEAEGLKWWGRA